MISEPLYRTEIDPLEIENFAPETKIVSIWSCGVRKTEGGRGHGEVADPKTLGKGPYDPCEASIPENLGSIGRVLLTSARFE